MFAQIRDRLASKHLGDNFEGLGLIALVLFTWWLCYSLARRAWETWNDPRPGDDEQAKK